MARGWAAGVVMARLRAWAGLCRCCCWMQRLGIAVDGLTNPTYAHTIYACIQREEPVCRG